MNTYDFFEDFDDIEKNDSELEIVDDSDISDSDVEEELIHLKENIVLYVSIDS
jgi:hypothetical protein